MSSENNQSGRPGRSKAHPPLRLIGAGGPVEAGASDDVAHVAHELSNLLDGSLRNLTLVLRGLNETADHHDLSDDGTVARLHDAAANMAEMAELLKGWMRSGARGLLAGLGGTSQTLGRAIEHAIRTVRPVAREQGIDLQVDLPPGCEAVPAGPLQPVIINGLRNAVEAVERDGQVEVHVERDGAGWVTVSITDDGPGVDTNLPRDRDGLVLPGASTKASGHGMGLAISRDLVRAMGGVIRLEDRQAGGAELIIRFPPQPTGPTR